MGFYYELRLEKRYKLSYRHLIINSVWLEKITQIFKGADKSKLS